MIQILLTDLVKDLRQGSSSFFTLKRSWSVPCGHRRLRHSNVEETFFSPQFQILFSCSTFLYYFLFAQHLPSAQCPVPSAQCLVPSAQCPVPCAQCPVPSAQCPPLYISCTTLQRKSDLCALRNETGRPQSQFPYSPICERFI
jgi:hypothetical protein